MTSPIEALEQKKDKAEQNKISKEVVCYVSRPETEYTCDSCIYYKEKKCALYGPTIEIKPYGGCNLYIHGEPGKIEIPWIGLVTKLETGYMENKQGFSCKRCEEFIPESNGCEKINKYSPGDDAGMINPNACCNRWEKDPKRGNMNTGQLLDFLK